MNGTITSTFVKIKVMPDDYRKPHHARAIPVIETNPVILPVNLRRAANVVCG